MQEQEKDLEVRANQELYDLGLETSKENIEAFKELAATRQLPEGYDEIVDNLDNPEKLKEAMEEKEIKTIIHSEGPTVWDHTRLAIEKVKEMDLSDEEEKDLKILMLYHDLGKPEVWQNEQNSTGTKKKLEKGVLQQMMIFHDRAAHDKIRQGFEVNGITGDKLDKFMTVVENHMKTSFLDQDPKITVKQVDSFGASEEQRKEVAKMLVAALGLDSEASERVDLVDGELKFSKNEHKKEISFDKIWKKYEEGQKMMEKEQEKQKAKQVEAEFEKSIFNGKLSDYLIKERGVKPGKEMGKIIGKVKGLLKKNRDKSPEEIRKIIDQTEL
jgi:hypothetical protein